MITEYSSVKLTPVYTDYGLHSICSLAQMACGARHSVAVTSEGLVFCWGWGLHGQCGLGEVQEHHPEPRLVRALAELKAAQVTPRQLTVHILRAA